MKGKGLRWVLTIERKKKGFRDGVKFQPMVLFA
jgi:hypothetical protein